MIKMMPEAHDPVQAWCSAHGIPDSPLARSARLRLPGGMLELRTNCGAFETYVQQRGSYLLCEPADEPTYRADALCLSGTGWPGVWPEPRAREGGRAEFGAFHSVCRNDRIEVWSPPHLLGVAWTNGSRRIRLLATGSDPERFPVPGPFRPKGEFGRIAHAELFDLMLCLSARVRGFTLLHGAVLDKQGRGLLLVGDSGCGKTTASLALLKGGYRLLSDEYAVMWNAGPLAGHFGGVLVPQMLVGEPPASLDSLEDTLGQSGLPGKSSFRVESARISREPVQLSAMCSLVRPGRRAARHEIAPLNPAQSFTLLMTHLLDPVGSGRGAAFEAISLLVERVPMYALTVGTRLSWLPAFLEQSTALAAAAL